MIKVLYSDEPNFPASDQHPDAMRYRVGDFWIDATGGEPTQAEIDAMLNPPAPRSVMPFQASRALLQFGMLDTVEAAVAAANRETQLAWNKATTIERNSPFVASMSATLGLSDAQLDDLFILAASFV
jgi:hypothetical protein